MKKILALFLSASLVSSPMPTKAVIVLPFFTVQVVKDAAGQAATFDFNFRTYPFGEFSQDFQVTTEDGYGDYFVDTVSAEGTVFDLQELAVPGWTNTGLSCESSNPDVSFEYLGSGRVLITGQPYSSAICNFTNTPTPSHTPVLIIAGVLGTEMFNNAQMLWLDLDGMRTDVGDQFMDALQFNRDLTPSNATIFPGEVLRKPTGTPATLVKYDYTHGLITELKNQGYTEGSGAGATLFTLPYDWRYGVSGKDASGENPNIKLLREKIAAIRVQTGADKVDVVAHSTGGLLLKRYVADTPDHHISKAVMVGVPNTGAPKAVKVLLSGDNFGIPWLADSEMKKISQNLPVLYDLAPSRTHVERKGSFLRTIEQKFLAKDAISDLDYAAAWELLTTGRGANAAALVGAEDLHTPAFEDLDLRAQGVDVYSIVGCKAATVSQVVERRRPILGGGVSVSYDRPKWTAGDGTVPLESATNLSVDADKKYYALHGEHGKMMSQDGTRQQIVNLLAGTVLPTSGITQDIADCKLKGTSHSVFSPLDIEVFDMHGNRLGKASDGSLQNDIPGADFSVFGDHKFVFLPDNDGQTYDITIHGTGEGSFTYKWQRMDGDAAGSMAVFSDVPVTTSLVGSVREESGTVRLHLNSLGNGSEEVVLEPSRVLEPNESWDEVSPVTVIHLDGQREQSGGYRAAVTVSFTAADTAQTDAATSGVEKTMYRLGDQQWMEYVAPVVVDQNGSHVIQFYSLDHAGNAELVQAATLKVERVPPATGSVLLPVIIKNPAAGMRDRWVSTVPTDNSGLVAPVATAGGVARPRSVAKSRRQAVSANAVGLLHKSTPAVLSSHILASSGSAQTDEWSACRQFLPWCHSLLCPQVVALAASKPIIRQGFNTARLVITALDSWWCARTQFSFSPA